MSRADLFVFFREFLHERLERQLEIKYSPNPEPSYWCWPD